MAGAKSITIVGGGLAGLTLGIGLRQRNVRVTICEAGNYPRHRVCGEFISGRGQATLARLGLRELIDEAGAFSARTTAFFSTTKSTAPRQLPSAAICLSRFTLDATLAKKFRELGGELRAGDRFAGDFAEGIVRATGRRVQTEAGGSNWFGLKIHARNVPLAADLEMHVSPRGYIGLCRINDGEVNVCGLFRKRASENGEAKNPHELLRGQPDSPLRQRLAHAEFDENSFCAVAGLSMRPQQAATRAEICVGEAITMIPPVTGNERGSAKNRPRLRRRVCAPSRVGEMAATNHPHARASKPARPARRPQRLVLAHGVCAHALIIIENHVHPAWWVRRELLRLARRGGRVQLLLLAFAH